jgi:hypothetical protein
LAEGAPADFRQALLEQTLGLARRRRQWRRSRRAGTAVLFLAALVGGLWWIALPRPRVSPTQPPPGSVARVQTRPLPLAAWVHTQPFPSEFQVTTGPTVAIVTTRAGGDLFREISDNELLALVAPKPVALVWRGPHAAELVFANPHDRDALLGN